MMLLVLLDLNFIALSLKFVNYYLNFLVACMAFHWVQMDRVGQGDPELEDEVRYRYANVIQLYRRSCLQDNANR